MPRLREIDVQLATRFADLLDDQAAGSAAARSALKADFIHSRDSSCLWTLYNEYREAFGYEPGRTEALEPIRQLARRLIGRKDNQSWLYKQPEWTTLLSMTGPVENVTVSECVGCNGLRISFGVSAFIDIAGAYCGQCGSVQFVEHPSIAPAPCECGPRAFSWEPCPTCGTKDTRNERWMSTYEFLDGRPVIFATSRQP